MIQESGEMYLETILLLSEETEDVHAVDVARQMGFSRPSVCRALGLLENDNLITRKDDHIHLTDSGLSIARKIYERHKIISSVLEKLGVDSETASEDACKIEHVISDTSFEAIKKLK